MAPSPVSRPPSSAEERALSRIATLLGAYFVTETYAGEQTRNDSVASRNSEALHDLLVSSASVGASLFPCLFLDSRTHGTHHHTDDREEVEAIAVANLSRSIVLVPHHPKRKRDSTNDALSKKDEKVKTAHSQNHHPLSFAIEHDPSEISKSMLRNFTASFELLVHARLRAYENILIGHAASLARGGTANAPDDCEGCETEGRGCDIGDSCPNIVTTAAEHKLFMLSDIGEGVGVDVAVIALRVQPDCPAHNAEQEILKDNALPGVVKMPLYLEVVLDVGVPNPVRGGRDCVTVSMEAPGTIEGCFDNESQTMTQLKSITVEFDTRLLLASMVKHACEVVTKAIENVNNAATAIIKCSPPEDRDVQAYAAREEKENIVEIDRDNKTDGLLAKLSPDSISLSSSVNSTVPTVVIFPDLRAIRDGSTAPVDPSPESKDSAENYADIVDIVIGEVDAIWLYPQFKRRKRGSRNATSSGNISGVAAV